jgi:glycosyltransferase involved in cell wall biosynthesis
MTKKKKVMVIGHEASLSGAPVLLLNLFHLLIKREIVDVQFVIRRGGPMVKEYKKIAPVIVLKPQKYGPGKNIFLYLVQFFANKIKLLLVLIKGLSCDYLFFNTVVNGKLMWWFKFHRKPTITYIHELEKVIGLYWETNDAVLPLTVSSVIAYPSIATKNLLIKKYKIPEQKLLALSYYFPFTEDEYDSDKALEMKRLFRQRLSIDAADFLVGTVGVVSIRKGIDLFIETCEKIVSHNSSIKFVWIGPFESNEQESSLRNLIKEKQLGSNLIFAGPLDYNLYNFSPFDIFFLSSREDTYPLVVLEAAMMKVPAICFSGSGGIIEFIGSNAGWVIDDFSTSQAANIITELQTMKDIILLRGETAFRKVIDFHCNGNVVIDQFKSVINQSKY